MSFVSLIRLCLLLKIQFEVYDYIFIRNNYNSTLFEIINFPVKFFKRSSSVRVYQEYQINFWKIGKKLGKSMRRAKRCFERTKRPSSEDAPSGVTPKVGGKRVNWYANDE